MSWGPLPADWHIGILKSKEFTVLLLPTSLETKKKRKLVLQANGMEGDHRSWSVFGWSRTESLGYFRMRKWINLHGWELVHLNHKKKHTLCGWENNNTNNHNNTNPQETISLRIYLVNETGSTAHWYFEGVMRCSMVSLHVGFNLYVYRQCCVSLNLYCKGNECFLKLNFFPPIWCKCD